MTTLLIQLAGPMQAWGASSRFTNRDTRTEPTKSGVLGMLAAAQGIRRTESIEHLLELSFGVRVDQPGTLMRDFQVARSLDGKDRMPLSIRYYLADAVFLSGVQGDSQLIESLASAIKRPVFPLYLGRRSCPPSKPLFVEITDQPVREALMTAEWRASERYRERQGKSVTLRAVIDAEPGTGDVIRDIPISFDPRRREYGWRTVEEFAVPMDNPVGRDLHDPLAFLGGV